MVFSGAISNACKLMCAKGDEEYLVRVFVSSLEWRKRGTSKYTWVAYQ